MRKLGLCEWHAVCLAPGMDAEQLQELLLDELRDLYDAEKQLVKNLPRMAEAAESEPLTKAIEDHIEVTKKQATRLEKAFEALGEKAESKPCKGMKGILDEGQEHVQEHSGDAGLDTVVAGAGRKVEHYEIAAYESAVELAETLGNRQVARLLQQTLAEEVRMERKLVQLSGRLLKQGAREKRKAA
jgi:ferritin-like metal-binding protein YciE